jgi:predicted DNA-binding transcriptional regulator YafY
MSIRKYTGQTIEMVYQDRGGRLTQRRIRVRAVRADKVYAFDLNKREPRVFCMERILAIQPVTRHVS